MMRSTTHAATLAMTHATATATGANRKEGLGAWAASLLPVVASVVAGEGALLVVVGCPALVFLKSTLTGIIGVVILPLVLQTFAAAPLRGWRLLPVLLAPLRPRSIRRRQR